MMDKQEMDTQEKDILFENRFTHTQEYYNELYFAIYFRKLRLAIGCLLIIAGSVLMAFGLGTYESIPVEIIVIGSSVATTFYLIIVLRYFRIRKLKYRQAQELNSNEPVEAVLFVHEEGIEILNALLGIYRTITFDKIEKALKTKHYYILITEAKIHWIFKKDGFTRGTSEEFVVFLASKGITCHAVLF